MTTKVLVTELAALPGTFTQGQNLSLQIGANNSIVAAVTSGGSDEVDSFLLAGM
jgi:hypothetical protein